MPTAEQLTAETARLTDLARSALRDWDAAQVPLADLAALERGADAALPGNPRFTVRAAEMIGEFGRILTAASRLYHVNDDAARLVAEMFALSEELPHIIAARDDINTVPSPEGDIVDRLGGVHELAELAGQRAVDAHVQAAVDGVPAPAEATGTVDRAQRDARLREQHQRAVQAARQNAEATSDPVRRAAEDAVIDGALAGPGVADLIEHLAQGSVWYANARTAVDHAQAAQALRRGTYDEVVQTGRGLAEKEARAGAEWGIRQNNAFDILVQADQVRYLPPGFGEPGPDPRAVDEPRPDPRVAEYPMGRGGRFVRLGLTRFSDHRPIADMIAAAVPERRWANQVRDGVPPGTASPSRSRTPPGRTWSPSSWTSARWTWWTSRWACPARTSPSASRSASARTPRSTPTSRR